MGLGWRLAKRRTAIASAEGLVGRSHVFCGRKGRRINLGFKLAIFLRSVDLGLNFPVCHRNVLDGEDCRIGLKLVIFLSSIALSVNTGI
jgi:hypothetical protein